MMDWERPFSIFNKDNSVPRMDNEELRAWRETWSIISKMESLKDLKVILKPHKYEVSYARRRKMCEPMMELKGLRKFELVIPWDDEENWDFTADAPFKVIRGVDRSKEADA
jgi:hypothetical protein